MEFRRGTEVKFVADPKKRPKYMGNWFYLKFW
jgi:hypothetical protein